ncbi:hypothetical protein ACJIZ3_025164 [Penstemon smallii]|uniref:F-box domain-containing protein n=1 Tax=Penstemon smallii TaxID=265156 RepID=A0ABD3TX67_9LAMI
MRLFQFKPSIFPNRPQTLLKNPQFQLFWCFTSTALSPSSQNTKQKITQIGLRYSNSFSFARPFTWINTSQNCFTKNSSKIDCCIGEDSISNLPEDVMSHILSLMPTKDAVRTSVLSKDWKRKWKTIYNLDFSDGEVFREQRRNISPRASMYLFVQKMIYRTKNSFKLFYGYKDLILSREILKCTSLRHLELVLPCTLKAPVNNCLPNLKTLCLEGVEIMNCSRDTHSIIFNFPVLETIEIRRCKWLNVKCVEIYAPALTTLNSETPLEDGLSDGYSIKIYAARLAKFKSSGGLPENIRSVKEIGSRFRMLLKGLSSVKDLHAWSHPANAFVNAGNHKINVYILSTLKTHAIFQSRGEGLTLPMFDKLERLDLDVYDYLNNEALLFLLEAAPFLKSLVLQVEYLATYWTREPLPSSIVSHLEVVKFNYFTGTACQFRLAEILLKNATKLKIIYLCDNGFTSLNEIAEQLSTIPKSSTCFTVTIVQ